MTDYEYSVAFHKGAFHALLNLKNELDSFVLNYSNKMIPKKTYKLLSSYLDVALHDVDSFMSYGQITHNIISDKNHDNWRFVTQAEADRFKQKIEERNKAAR